MAESADPRTVVYIASFMAGEQEGIRTDRWDAASGAFELES